MLGKKMLVSVIALAAVCYGAFGAINRGGTLKSQPGSTGAKVSSQQNTGTATVTTGSRMATLPGLNNISTKPKLPSSASAAQVGDLKDKLDQLAQDVADLANAGVDEGAVRDIITSELNTKDYATKPYVDTADNTKLNTSDFENQFDTRAAAKHLVDESALSSYAKTADVYDKDTVDSKMAAIKPSASIRYDETTGDLQYQDSDNAWQTFANRADFAGADGKSIELQKTDNAIQWRVKGTDTWEDLVGLDEITGAAGTVDADQLEQAVNAAIEGKNLATKTDLNDYVDTTTYNSDKTATDNKITQLTSAVGSAQATAETALSTAQGKVDAATFNAYKDTVSSNLATKANASDLNAYVTNESLPGKMNDWADTQTKLATKAELAAVESGTDQETLTGIINDVVSNNYVSNTALSSYQQEVTSALAAKADNSDVLPKDIKFSKREIEGVNYFILEDLVGNLIAKLAPVDELKGDDGQTPCTSITFEEDTEYTGTDGTRYNVICVTD